MRPPMSDAVDTRVSKPLADARLRLPSLLQLIREDVGCVRLRDPAARSELETLLTYPGVHALIWHRIAHRLWEAGWKFPARLLSWLGRFLSNVDIHPAAKIGRRFFIDHGAGVVIGETAEIGNDVTLYHGVTLGGTSWSPGKRHPTLEDRVVVGIPARVVRPELTHRRVVGRIDLDHHLMPDPVGEALSVVLDRVEFLEARLAHLQKRLRDGGSPSREDKGAATPG